MAGALALLGTKHALLVCSEDGLDELSISAPTRVVEVVGGDSGGTRSRQRTSGLRARRPSRSPAATRSRTPRPRGDPRRRAGRCARSGRAERRRRDLRRWPRGDARGRSAGGRARDRHGAAPHARAVRRRTPSSRAVNCSIRSSGDARRGGAPARSVPPAERRGAAARAARRDSDALSRGARPPGPAVIAEHKRRSPSAGVIRAGLELADVVGAYERGGAAALSILTEGPASAGRSPTWRRPGRLGLPILRKDFIVDPYQVHETSRPARTRSC